MSVKLTRRDFLKASAVTVLAATMQACAQPTPTPKPAAQPTAKPAEPTKPAAAAPTAAPTAKPAEPTKPAAAAPTAAPTAKPAAMTYGEAPQLAELVKAGKLPPVAERLPKEPMVVQVIDEIGTYGGTWRRAFLGASDVGGGMSRLTLECLLYFTADGKEFVPNAFTKWEISDEAKTYTFKLREGIKWSDGKPLTTDDLMFWFEDIALNKELTPSLPAWLNFGGAQATFEKVDDFTLRMKFAKGYALLPLILTGQSFGNQREYWKQFHPKYADKAKLDQAIKDNKFETWIQLFGAKNNIYDNVDMPTWNVWVTKSRVSDQRHILERNPYYWKVDPKGNQLPYIDQIAHDLVGSPDIVITKMLAGEVDNQGRHIAIDKVPLLQENAAKGGYHVVIWTIPYGVSSMVMFNMSFDGDPIVAKYMLNKKFRQAFSMCIDRDDFNRVIYLGRGKPRQATTIDSSADFKPEYATRYVKLDLDAAGKIFDELGLNKKDAEGYRIAPENGQALTLINYVMAGSYDSHGQLITDYLKKAGIKVLMKAEERSIHYQRMTANELQLSMWGMDTALYPLWLNYAYWIVPWVQGSVRIGPAFGLYRDTGGKSGKKPEGEVAKALDLFDAAVNELDPKKKIDLASQVLDVASDNVWTCGIVQLTDSPHVVSNKMANVPTKAIDDTQFRTEKNTYPEQYFFKK